MFTCFAHLACKIGVKLVIGKPTSQEVKSQHLWIRHVPL